MTEVMVHKNSLRDTESIEYSTSSNGKTIKKSSRSFVRMKKNENIKLLKAKRKLSTVKEKTNTHEKFKSLLKKIFNVDENSDMEEIDVEGSTSQSATLLSKQLLEDLCVESAKLNALGAMESISVDKLTKLLVILEGNIRDATEVCPISDSNDKDSKKELFTKLVMGKIRRAIDASLTALYILTSPNMPKKILIEDVIDQIIIFTKFQLNNTIYPAFDPGYRVQSKEYNRYRISDLRKSAHCYTEPDRNINKLYLKLTEVISLLGKLMDNQCLTDNTILYATSMGISPFFVEGVRNLQLAALKLIINIFANYEKHRKLVLDDILASIGRLPSNKRSSFRLNSEEQIQILTALVLQLVQCMIFLPPDTVNKHKDVGLIVDSKFKASKIAASNFLHAFLSKCNSKIEEINYKPIFENFIQDLLNTFNKPEWPVAELMLVILGNLLLNNIINKSLEMSLRVASLDYLGIVVARLRKDVVSTQLIETAIDQLIKNAQIHQSEDKEIILDKEERTQLLRKLLLHYLTVKGQTESVFIHARSFYLAQWYQECDECIPLSTKHNQGQKGKSLKKKYSRNNCSEDTSLDEETEDTIKKNKIIESIKTFLLSKLKEDISSYGKQTENPQFYIDYSSAQLITAYLASKRPLSRCLDVYLKHILKALTETSIIIRTKAMKCLNSIIEADPSVLALKEVQLGVHHSFFDQSTSVRDIAVDLVGKYILSQPELVASYYNMLSLKLLDTGISVRKRAIKILRDICVQCPNFEKIPEICVKIIRRLNDEDGIRRLVLDTFTSIWFTPVLDSDALNKKVMNMIKVFLVSDTTTNEWFEKLLLSLFNVTNEDNTGKQVGAHVPLSILNASRQIVDFLLENAVRLDVSVDSQRLRSCMTILYIFAKVRPQLLVIHALTIEPYLSLKCQTQVDYHVISYVARILELVVPLIEHPPETFLSRIEEDSVKLMFQMRDPLAIVSCASCLGSVVNNITRNFTLIRDCLKKYYAFLNSYKEFLYRSTTVNNDGDSSEFRIIFRRYVFVVGLLLRFFDFTNKEIIGDLPETIKDDICDVLICFLKYEKDSLLYTLKSVGSVCIRHYELMLNIELKSLYQKYLSSENVPSEIKVQVLTNIENYLQEEEQKMIKEEQEWAERSKTEDLKEMSESISGRASMVIQLYLKESLDTFIHPNPSVRHAATRVTFLILAQGLVHPAQIVPYLICMSTDEYKVVNSNADKHLQDIENRYPGFIHMKAQYGIQLSYKLQKIIQNNTDIVRGFKIEVGKSFPSALNGFLYSVLRTKQYKRALLLSILKQFENLNGANKTRLPEMLYLADNLAYFPYQVIDEPLFIIYHIDIIISVSDNNFLKTFEKALIPLHYEDNQNITEQEDDDEEEEYNNENEEILLSRIPEDIQVLEDCLAGSLGCLLLLLLKKYLITLYGLNSLKLMNFYTPMETGKTYEKCVHRNKNIIFNPYLIIEKLKQESSPVCLSDERRKLLVSIYVEYKKLMININEDIDNGVDYKSDENVNNITVTEISNLEEPENVEQNRTAINDMSVKSKEEMKQSTPSVITNISLLQEPLPIINKVILNKARNTQKSQNLNHKCQPVITKVMYFKCKKNIGHIRSSHRVALNPKEEIEPIAKETTINKISNQKDSQNLKDKCQDKDKLKKVKKSLRRRKSVEKLNNRNNRKRKLNKNNDDSEQEDSDSDFVL